MRLHSSMRSFCSGVPAQLGQKHQVEVTIQYLADALAQFLPLLSSGYLFHSSLMQASFSPNVKKEAAVAVASCNKLSS